MPKTKKYLLAALVLFIAFSATAKQKGKRVYQEDSTGHTLHYKQSRVLVKGGMCPVDTVGSRQHHKPCFEIELKEMDKQATTTK